MPWRTALAGIATAGGIGLILLAVSLSTGAKTADDGLVYYTVQRSQLPITVTERGTLESQFNTEIVCEVEDVGGDGISGTPILWIVPNGTQVKKGDLLVELDASSHRERLDEQVLDAERAQASYLNATTQFENQKSRNRTALKKAEMNVTLSEMALKQFENEEGGGTFQIDVQDAELAIKQSLEATQISDDNLDGMRMLVDKGYKSQGDLNQAKFQAIQAHTSLERLTLERDKLVTLTHEKQSKILDGKLQSAKRALRQVLANNAAREEQARIAAETAKRRLEREQERLERYRSQLENCKIFAPRDGMVAYAVESSRWGQSSTIAEGQAVRERQVLMTIPDLSQMQVKTSIHESVVDRVKAGLRTTVRIDAFPEKSLQGTVQSVAVLPDPGGWLSSDIKVYETVVTIDSAVTQLKPGMTAVAEIQVVHLKDVLTVPVQALVQRGRQTWCYVQTPSGPSKRTLEVGRTNDKYVEIAGLQEGDQVVLNPAAILNVHEDEVQPVSPDTKRVQEVSLD